MRDLSDITKHFDSASLCLSKGLGTPAGSVLVGSKEFIKEARHYRKMIGGGLRQAGILASAGIYALDNHIEDLKKDHKLAKYLADELRKIEKITVVSNHTNMMFIQVEDENKLKKHLEKNNILISGYGKLRLVIHRDIKKEDVKKTILAFKSFYN